jgi:Tol biopolymer transport system component
METSIIPESSWIKLTNHSQGADSPAWYPDGSEIVYMTWDETSLGTIYKMKADGTDHTSLEVTRVGHPDISSDGSKIASGGFGQIWICNYDGTNHHAIYGKPGTICEPGSCYLARWSPDDSRLAVFEYTSYTGDLSHIITINPDETDPDPKNLTDSDAANQYPSWSPDGSKIAYNRDYDIWIMDSDGQNPERLTYFGDAVCPVWSPDGSSIFFHRQPGSPWWGCHIYRMNIDGTNIVQLTDSTGEWSPAISPDGRWIAFTAYDENDQRNIYKAELSAPMLDLTPDTGFSSTTVVGSGFAISSKVTLMWDSTVIPAVPSPLITDSKGNFTAIISVLTQNDPGPHTVKATDESGNWASATFTVIDMTGLQGPPGQKGDTGDTGPQGSPGETRELSLIVDAFTIAASIIAICLATIALLRKKT